MRTLLALAVMSLATVTLAGEPIIPAKRTVVSNSNVVDLTDPTNIVSACDTCPPTLMARIAPRLAQQRPTLDCLGCSNFRCEWRFIWGSCRAFYNEGPYKPIYPDTCKCAGR